MKKLVVITGASSGVGKALALYLSQSQHSLLLIARREDALQEVAEKCRENGSRVAIVACDLRSEREFQQVKNAIQLDQDQELVLVNNAGVSHFGPFHEMTSEQILSQLETNVLGTISLTHALLPLMLERGRGQILTILSVAIKTTLTGAAAYSAAKAALGQFSQCISLEYRKHGIRVTGIVPGAIATPLWGEDSPPKEKMIPADELVKAITGVIESSPELVIDELVITPPDGIL